MMLLVIYQYFMFPFFVCIEGLVDFEVELFALLVYYMNMELNFIVLILILII